MKAGARSPQPEPLRAFAVAPPGFEGVVAEELSALGLRATRVDGGAEFSGSLRDVYCANLRSRVSSRVLLRVGEVEAATFPALARALRELPWGRWLPKGASVSWKVAKRRTPLYHTGRVADAGMEALAAGIGARPPVQGEPSFVAYLRLDGPRVWASLDTSGEHLHRRGYRTDAGPAPLRENLAAGLLLLAGWTGGEPLLDPFCGSGTFPAEAGLLALRIPPGHRRGFAFERFVQFDSEVWAALRAEAEASVLSALPVPIFGSDRDPAAVALTARSLRRAGLADHVQVAVADLRELEPPADRGLLVANPPYGVRLRGGGASVRALGEALRGPFCRWRWATVVLAGPEQRLPLRQQFSFRSGGLRLRWLQGGPVQEESMEGELL